MLPSSEIPFRENVIVLFFVDEKILIVEKGISENLIFYLLTYKRIIRT